MVKIKTQIVVYKKAHAYKAYNRFLFFFNCSVLSKSVICVKPCSHVTTCGPQTTGWICMQAKMKRLLHSLVSEVKCIQRGLAVDEVPF